mgnify:CR=1 FL=1
MIKALIILSLLVAILALLLWWALKKISKLTFLQKSWQTRWGKTMEQLMPFFYNYPYDPTNFHFLGNPIDGIQFEDEQIIFLEFKTGKSTMNGRQRQVRRLVEAGKVTFQEYRVD